MKIDKDSPQVRVPPPASFLVFLILAVVANRYYPLSFISGSARYFVAGILGMVGIVLLIHCVRLFLKHRTHIEPWKTTSTIITTGAYRFSRNPVYLSVMMIGLGVACAANNLWTALFLPLFAAVVYFTAIRKEERYLEEKFGEAYLTYKRRVRRWI